MKTIFKIFLILIIVSSVKAGGFDDLGNSARVFSLGGAYTAVADAPYSIFYNPAGIYRLNKFSVSTTYSNLYPGIQDDNLNYFSLSAIIPLGIVGEFGVGGTFLNTNLWQENMVYGTYARELFKSFAVGGTAKLLRWSAGAAPGEAALSYLGFTFDAGFHYTLNDIFNGSDLRIGLAAQNITQPSIASNGNSDAKLPMILAAGLAYVSISYNYLVALDFVKEGDAYYIKTGAEFLGLRQQVLGLNTGFLVRAGYNGTVNDTPFSRSGINGGFGLEVENLIIDYAYVYPLELTEVGGSHKVSLSYNFNF